MRLYSEEVFEVVVCVCGGGGVKSSSPFTARLKLMFSMKSAFVRTRIFNPANIRTEVETVKSV